MVAGLTVKPEKQLDRADPLDSDHTPPIYPEQGTLFEGPYEIRVEGQPAFVSPVAVV
jgi:hypothetical protein